MFDMRLNEISKYCRYLLKNSSNAEEHRAYLNSRISLDMQEKFEFGLFPSIKDINLLSDMISVDTLKQIGLIYNKEIKDSSGPRNILFNFFEDQPLIMPYKDAYGNVVALVGRTLLNDIEREKLNIEKYKNTSFTKGNYLFGLYEAKRSILEKKCVYVVEGQFDVIKAHQKGLTNVVAVGSSNMTAYQFSLLCRYTNNIHLLLDNDVAGQRGRRDIEKKYGSYANVKNVYLPDRYKDIDDYLKENDAASISFLCKDDA